MFAHSQSLSGNGGLSVFVNHHVTVYCFLSDLCQRRDGCFLLHELLLFLTDACFVTRADAAIDSFAHMVRTAGGRGVPHFRGRYARR